jgi:2-keto-4-pentenoate hydratase
MSDEALVEALFQARQKGLAGPELADPELITAEDDLRKALDLQLAVLERSLAAGERLGGWKVGHTSGSRRGVLGRDFRPFGYILDSRITQSGYALRHGRITSCFIEPELCLVLGAPLRGEDVDPVTARDAVRAVAPAFELNEARLPPGAGHPAILADGLSNWGIVVGAEVPVRPNLTGTTVELWRDGELVTTKTPGDSMDDPFLSLSRLCALLHQYGRGLEPGQRVITGSFCNETVEGPSSWRADFSGIGEVAVRFSSN